jgi:branched-chain amino acid transport system permease protein
MTGERRHRPVLALAAGVLALGFFPLLASKPYALHMGVMLLLAVAQGQAWNIVGGYAGQHSLGHAAYFGVGAYATALLLDGAGVPPWVGIWVGLGAALLLSLVIGSITFRLRGPYFVLASISSAEIIRLVVMHFKSFTRGAEGILLRDLPPVHLLGGQFELTGKRPFYYAALVLAAATTLVALAVERSKLGYYFQAIREDQDAAQSLGINLALYKNIALALSAVFTAAAGAIYAVFVQFVDPGSVFGLDVSVQTVLVCIVGGIGKSAGPVLGALVLVPLSEVLRNPKGLSQIGLVRRDSPLIAFVEAHLNHAHLLVYGVLVVAVVLVAPDGALGIWRRVAFRLNRGRG